MVDANPGEADTDAFPPKNHSHSMTAPRDCHLSEEERDDVYDDIDDDSITPEIWI